MSRSQVDGTAWRHDGWGFEFNQFSYDPATETFSQREIETRPYTRIADGRYVFNYA